MFQFVRTICWSGYAADVGFCPGAALTKGSGTLEDGINELFRGLWTPDCPYTSEERIDKPQAKIAVNS